MWPPLADPASGRCAGACNRGHMTPEGQHWFADLQRRLGAVDAAVRKRDSVARHALAHSLGTGCIAHALRIDKTTAQSRYGDQPTAG